MKNKQKTKAAKQFRKVPKPVFKSPICAKHQTIPLTKLVELGRFGEKYVTMDFAEIEQNNDVIEKYVKSVAAGDFGSLIISGPPGIGKTYTVDRLLQEYVPEKYKLVTGHMTPLSLYANMYNYRASGHILVLDDVDSVFSDVTGLNLLKAAMDTKVVRNIHWESSSKLLAHMGLPPNFEFKGSIILISNIGFKSASNKLKVHLDAVKDRTFTVQVSDGSNEDLYKQVCFMVLKRGLLDSYELDTQESKTLLDYLGERLDSFNTVSLRLALNLATLMKTNPTDWRAMANSGLASLSA